MGCGKRNHSLPPLDRPWLYAISDGSGWEGFERLRLAALAGVDLVQVREKQLPAGELLAYCQRLRAALPAGRPRLLVNDRLEIALAAGLDGVHCPARGLPLLRMRERVRAGFLLGQSCHNLAEIEAAEGADFCVFGPVFATPSKQVFGPPLGLDALEAAVQASRRPVLALGGITLANAAACLERGAAGIAGIRIFQAPALAAVRGTLATRRA